MNHSVSPLWVIETTTTEKEAATGEPRSLWDRVEAHLRPQEVFTIRRIIGEKILDRNEGLWREVDALEDILREANDQNEQLSKKLAARPTMPPGLHRTLLEAHLRLLLGKLGGAGAGGAAGAAGTEGGGWSGGGGSRGQAVAERGAASALSAKRGDRGGCSGDGPQRLRDGELARRPDRSCCAPEAGSRRGGDGSSSSPRKHRFSSSGGGGGGGNKTSSSSSSSKSSKSKSAPPTAPSTPAFVPLESEQDRAVYEFISTSGRGSDGGGGWDIGSSRGLTGTLCATVGARGGGSKGWDGGSLHRGYPAVGIEDPVVTAPGGEGAAAVAGRGGGLLVGQYGSRPGTGRRRPGSSRSARSAPECLESGRRPLSVASIDTALGELLAAFEDEAQNLLEEVADLTDLLEDQARRKTDTERRCRRDTPATESSTSSSRGSGGVGGGSRGSGGGSSSGGGGGGAIPLSELRRYGKKLEEAVRSREHAADVTERLSLTRRAKSKPGGGGGAHRRKQGRDRTDGGGGGSGGGSGGDNGRRASGGGNDYGGGGGGASLSPVPRGGIVLDPASAPGRPQEPLNYRRGIGEQSKASRSSGSGRGSGSDSGSGGGSGSFVHGEAKDGTDPATATWGSEEKKVCGRGDLARRLRGAVRVSREEEALDDERFWC